MSRTQMLGVAAGVCLFLALMPGFSIQGRQTASDSAGGRTVETTTSVSLGLPFSPLLHVERRTVETHPGAVGESHTKTVGHNYRLGLVSWSSALAVVASVCAILWRGQRPVGVSSEAPPAQAS